ncbi:hypothetical protein TGAMA5MH_10982 [Trichoderma gamsii]|uniref:Uncharacterized protein n=1 Tax=Trichoderma gamsii TaxID=398673 RepID=A0A2K0SV00_9HYPO|nr:hypothetical protein TGAMA5MH_10982 [Trichoderma gamsii]
MAKSPTSTKSSLVVRPPPNHWRPNARPSRHSVAAAPARQRVKPDNGSILEGTAQITGHCMSSHRTTAPTATSTHSYTNTPQASLP